MIARKLARKPKRSIAELEREVAELKHALSEAHEQQVAVSDILRVISGTATDVKPVLRSIAEHAMRLCQSADARIWLVEGDRAKYVTGCGSIAPAKEGETVPLHRGSGVGRAILDRKPLHIADAAAASPREFPIVREMQRRHGHRTMLNVPLMREKRALGAITLRKMVVEPFTKRQIALVRTFADQAAIAIENVRLYNEAQTRNAELTESLEQQTATSEILRIISSSPTDTQPVFDAIVKSGVRLFCGLDMSLRLVKGDQIEQIASTRGLDGFAVPLNDESFPPARAILRGETVNIADMLAEDWINAEAKRRAERRGHRAIAFAPMFRGKDAIGVIIINRGTPGLFTEKQIALLKTFADQAVIAIENSRLFNETKEALEHQTATSEILRIISESPTDTQPVFDAIVKSGVHLFGGMNVSLSLVRGVRGDHTETVASTLPIREIDGPNPISIGDDSFPRTRAMFRREVVQIPDFLVAEDWVGARAKQRAEQRGFRAVLVAPMLRENEPIGSITVTRATPGPFTDKQIALLKTFADQAVIAIENARLFNETKEALEQQTATSEILNVISHSTLDVTPVFQSVVEKAVKLCGADNASILQREGDLYRYVANAGNFADQDAFMSFWGTITLRPGRGSLTGRVALERRSVQIEDVDTDREYEREYAAHKVSGSKAHLGVPLLKDGEPIGLIIARRFAPRLFTEKQIKILETFAAQAVIAVENVRLFKELQARNAEITEALEQQTATAEILRVISSSPTDTQPVFDAIVKSGVHLFGGWDVTLRLVKGDQTELVASTRRGDVSNVIFNPVNDDRVPSARAILRREVVQIPDILAENWVREETRRRAKSRGLRALMVAPMLRENSPIGVISVNRAAPGPFTDKQVALLKTFADQAVIAIENVRLFNETKEALEQQTVISEILRVISSSPTDVQPVFDAIVNSGQHLFSGINEVSLRLVKGDLVETVASTLPIQDTGGANPAQLDDESMPAPRALRRREVVQIPDILAADEWVGARAKQRAEQRGWRALLAAPMLRENNAIGVIAVTRVTPGPFTDKQIALLKTFADQAVIAIENVRLFKELQARNAEVTEALEQQTATAGILSVISKSPTDTQPVFNAVVNSGVHLFRGLNVSVLLVKGDQVDLAASTLLEPELSGFYPFPLEENGMVSCRAILRRELVQVPDVVTEDWISGRMKQLGESRGFKAVIAAPLLRENKAIGAIAVTRATAGPFSDKEVALLNTFADQAVIAIENVRLFNETKEALEQQTVISEILRVISSSPTDVQPVFDAIVKSGVHLFRGMNVSLRLVKGDQTETVASTLSLRDDGPIAYPLNDDRNASSRAILRREVVQIPDIFAEDWVGETTKQRAERRGHRSVMVAPMLRENTAIGTIAVTRAAPGPFTDKQIALLKTFADQAVIAIENVRLFKELQARNAEITEALEQQTATADILRVISSSPTDTQPVFDAILENATRLCDAHLASLGLYDGEKYQHVAQRGGNSAYVKYLLRGPFDPASAPTIGRMITERQAIHIPDVMETPYYRAGVPAPVAMVELGGGRTVLAVPMLKDGRMVGGIFIYRPEVRPFTQKQIDLVSTFASQAVIAIENVRLFKEINEALQQQTSIAEILRVISSTPTDVMPVLDAVTHRAAQLCDAPDARLFLVDGDTLRYVAGFGELKGARPTLPLTRGLVTGRAILDRSVVHIEDLAATLDEFPEARGPQREFGSRTTLAVPLVRENRAFGGIVMRRKEVRPFTAKQIELVKTFADQAVIAIENVRLFNEIQDKSLQLEIANKHKSEFLANMSHELRTPLNAINGFSEMLLARMFGEVNAKQEEFLRDIHSSGEHLLSLINDILDLSKIEAGRMELNLAVIDLAETLENTVMLVKERAARRGITVKLEVDERLDKWVADERKFRQIMLNLLSNALKFTPEGGQIGVLAAQDGSNMVVAVTDTGVGIRPEDQALIFEEFQQAGSDYTKKAEGTGLGLALTRKFVELHGGTIRVESAEGKGSTFTFTLPLNTVSGER